MRGRVARWAVRAAAAIAAVAGCGDEPECRPRAEELGRFLTSMDHDMTLFTPAEDVQLVTRTDLSPVELRLGPVVDVVGTRVRLDGEVIAGRADLASRLARAYDTSRGLAPPGGFPAPAERATEAARITTDIVSRCGALEAAFGRVAAVAGEDKAATLLAAVGPALIECDCKADLPALRTALWRVAGNPRPMSFLPVRLAPDAPPLSLPATTPWREASQRLAIGASPVRLTL